MVAVEDVVLSTNRSLGGESGSGENIKVYYANTFSVIIVDDCYNTF